MRNGWRRLGRLSCGELVSLPIVWLCSVLGAVALRRLSVLQISRLFSTLGRLCPLGSSSERSYDLADVAARLTPGAGRCLTRSLLLLGLLRGDRRLKIGVRLEDGKLASHAWVELGERVVGDRHEVTEQFAPLLDRQTA